MNDFYVNVLNLKILFFSSKGETPRVRYCFSFLKDDGIVKHTDIKLKLDILSKQVHHGPSSDANTYTCNFFKNELKELVET